MESTNPVDRHNVQRQLAIYEVAKISRDRTLTEIKQLLREEFQRRGVPEQPETWLDGVAVEATFGKPYIIDFTVAQSADKVMKTRGRAPDQGSGRSPGWLPGVLAVAAVGGVVVLALGAASGIAGLRRRNR